MRFPLARRLLTLASLVASAACAGDGPSAAVAPSFDAAGPALAKGSSSINAVLTVDPSATRIYHVGQNWIYIPAGAVCDLASTSYGASEWDSACERQQAPFELTVTIGQDAHGRPVARFSPDMRFAPASSPYAWVVIGLQVKGRLDTSGYGILYQPTGSSEWIDESRTDPTLRAWRAPGNIIARRVKHFSGYNVSLGFQEQEVQLSLGGAF